MSRHLNIGNQQINSAATLMQNAEGLHGVFGFENLNSSTLQKEAEVGAKSRFIVNDKTEGLVHKLSLICVPPRNYPGCSRIWTLLDSSEGNTKTLGSTRESGGTRLFFVLVQNLFFGLQPVSFG